MRKVGVYSLGEISKKPSWKLKTISNVNIVVVFFKSLTNEMYNLQSFHHGLYIGKKSSHICQFEENSFSEDFGTGTFNPALLPMCLSIRVLCYMYY